MGVFSEIELNPCAYLTLTGFLRRYSLGQEASRAIAGKVPSIFISLETQLFLDISLSCLNIQVLVKLSCR